MLRLLDQALVGIYADGAADLEHSKNRGNPRYHGDLSSLAIDIRELVSKWRWSVRDFFKFQFV